MDAKEERLVLLHRDFHDTSCSSELSHASETTEQPPPKWQSPLKIRERVFQMFAPGRNPKAESHAPEGDAASDTDRSLVPLLGIRQDHLLLEIMMVPGTKREMYEDATRARQSRIKLLQHRQIIREDYSLDERWVPFFQGREGSQIRSKRHLLMLLMLYKQQPTTTASRFSLRKESHVRADLTIGIEIRFPVESSYQLVKAAMRFLCDDEGYDYTVREDYLCKLSVAGFDADDGLMTIWLCPLPLVRCGIVGHESLATRSVAKLLAQLWSTDDKLGPLVGSLVVFL